MMKIKNKIHDCIDRMINQDIPTQTQNIFETYLSLVSIIELTQLTSQEIELYFNDPDVISYLKKGREFFNQWEIYLESIMKTYFLSGKLPVGIDSSLFEKIRTYYINKYRNLVINEINLANINQSTRVCHVGVGSMPLSLLMLHKYSKKCPIIGIDFEESSVIAARQCIEFKATTEQKSYDASLMSIEHMDGANFNYSDIDVVIISSSIINKQEIFYAIKKTANRNILLIDRKIHGLSRYVYQSSDIIKSDNYSRDFSQFGLIQAECYSINVAGN